ncbi:hypothetical protein RFI_25754, partial [Reticulomyxa filosa]
MTIIKQMDKNMGLTLKLLSSDDGIYQVELVDLKVTAHCFNSFLESANHYSKGQIDWDNKMDEEEEEEENVHLPLVYYETTMAVQAKSTKSTQYVTVCSSLALPVVYFGFVNVNKARLLRFYHSSCSPQALQ